MGGGGGWMCMTCFPVCKFLACLYIGKVWLLGMGVWERGDGGCGRGFGLVGLGSGVVSS